MSRYIDADKMKLILKMAAGNNKDNLENCDFVSKCLDVMPSANVSPVIHAHWIKHEFYEYGCSKCHTANDYKSAYCPSCGAIMDEEEQA